MSEFGMGFISDSQTAAAEMNRGYLEKLDDGWSLFFLLAAKFTFVTALDLFNLPTLMHNSFIH